MRPGRVVAIVIGCLLVLPALAMLAGGAAMGGAYAFARDGDGYFTATIDRVATDTVAVTADDLDLGAEPGSPDWLVDALDADVRLQVEAASSERAVFVGIGPSADVDAYLAGVAHERVIDLDAGLEPDYRAVPGGDEVEAPVEQDFWVAAATGRGEQELEWEATSGRWTVVVMNADGSPAVSARVEVGIRSGVVLPLAIGLLAGGALLTALAVTLIVLGAAGGRPTEPAPAPAPGAPIPAGVPGAQPVRLQARLDPALSRWQWLVKWFLAIPHLIVLAVLWLAFVVLTFVAGVVILFTGRYPRGIFDFNVGVLRWTWRVSYYATTGGIGTDRYPPFSLQAQPGDPATLDVEYPEQLSRPLVLVKWLLALPHLIVVGVVAGGSVRWLAVERDQFGFDLTGGGLLGILVLIAGGALLFTGRYPPALFDLIVGLNRWVYRVAAYVALMTDRYPPFRLDQGGTEPHGPLPPPVPGPATSTAAAPPLPAEARPAGERVGV